MKHRIPAALLATFAVFIANGPLWADPASGPGAELFSSAEKFDAVRQPDEYLLDPQSMRLRLLSITGGDAPAAMFAKEYPPGKPVDLPVFVDQVINISAKVWEIFAANKPSVGVDAPYAAAVPRGIGSWQELCEWRKPVTRQYGFSARNLVGNKTVEVVYKVVFQAGGKYRETGQYLTGVGIIPVKVSAKWGFKFSMTAEVPDSTVVNAGSTEDPVAAMQLKLTWKISSPLKTFTGASVYYIKGDGSFEEIASPFSAPLPDSALKTTRRVLPFSGISPANFFELKNGGTAR